MLTTSAAHGVKYICADTTCATRFYDMNKSPIACPKCGKTVPAPAKKPAARRGRRVETSLNN